MEIEEKKIEFNRRFNAEFNAEFFQKIRELKIHFHEKVIKKIIVKCVNFTYDALLRKVEKTDYKELIHLMEEYNLTAQEAKKMLEKED